ncbi:PolyA RNA polymerase cid13 [Gigaspora margarita]|uniref:PolyA RNA polymerase cid13 n=1 Tax=Gigaspora margarita TaxID=4874 RepID=A0A8H4A176_GIGMA|nr:PolyA RNA polymerase cid13 [Gigaspora margarita]
MIKSNTNFVKKIKEILSNEWFDHKIEVHIFGSSMNLLNNINIVKCVADAKVPIVKFWNSNLKLNSAFGNDHKILAQQQDLNNAAYRTLSSYFWTCIILNFLQICDLLILPVLQIPGIPLNNEVDLSVYQNIDSFLNFGNKNHESIRRLLLAFFEYFAYKFDYKYKVISLRQGKFLNKQEKNWSHWKLCIEEPFNI